MNWLDFLQRSKGRIPLGEGVVEFLSWAYVPYLPDNVPHRHTYFEVCQMGAHGEGQFIVEGVEHPITPGDLFIARPGVIHQIVNTMEPLMELYWVSFGWLPGPSGETEIDHLLGTFSRSSVLVSRDEVGQIATLWQALRTVCDGTPRLGQETLVEGLMASLVIAIAQAGSDEESISPSVSHLFGHEPTAARMAVRYLHDNLDRPLTVKEIADHVSLSPRHLCRLFQQHTGVSPNTYLIRARMDRAEGLLLHTQDPIKAVAAAVGYDDVHYFTRVFTRYFNSPPASFRREGGSSHVRNIQKIGALV